MLTIHTFASGSSGNCLLVSDNGTHILVDAGISCRRITTALGQLGLTLSNIDAICITHEHSDHVSGLQTLVRKHNIPIYTSAATGRQLSYRIAGIEPLLCRSENGDAFTVGNIQVSVFSTSHDAACSVDFRFDGEGSAGVLTDTGFVTDDAFSALMGVDLLILESNHDVDWVRNGPYPYQLQERILGDKGHLCNETAAAFALQMANYGTRHIVLAHLSHENNTPQRAMDTMTKVLADIPISVTVAPRNDLSPCYTTEGCVCRK